MHHDGVALTPRHLVAALLLWGIETAAEQVCHRQTPGDSHHKNRDKKCPDFKSDESKQFCCPSKIDIGGFFCCDKTELDSFEDEARSKQWKEFLSTYIGVLVVGFVIVVVVGVCLAYIVCRRFCLKQQRDCRWYNREGDNYASGVERNLFANRAKRRRTTIREAELATQLERERAAPAYRPIEGQHKIYEAPPPYSPATTTATHSTHHAPHHGLHHLPPPPAVVDQQRNDWNCLIENEVNDGRPSNVPNLPPPPF